MPGAPTARGDRPDDACRRGPAAGRPGLRMRCGPRLDRSARRLVIRTDLRLFMPSPRTARNGSSSTRSARVRLRECSCLPSPAPIRRPRPTRRGHWPPRCAPAARTAPGRGMADPASDVHPRFTARISIPAFADTRSLEAGCGFLRAQLEERVRDLVRRQPQGSWNLGCYDPTLELLKLADSSLPARQPQDSCSTSRSIPPGKRRSGRETRAAGFDPQGRREAADARCGSAFESSRTDDNLRIRSEAARELTPCSCRSTRRGRHRRLGSVDVIGMVILLLVAYRRPLPVVCSGPAHWSIAGRRLRRSAPIFGTVHGMPLAFGFTLIGVARTIRSICSATSVAGSMPRSSVRACWPTLPPEWQAPASLTSPSCSGVHGLAQLSVFTVSRVSRWRD